MLGVGVGVLEVVVRSGEQDLEKGSVREMSHPLVLAPSTRSSLRNGLQAGMAISLPGALFHPESVVENNKLTFTLGSVECKE